MRARAAAEEPNALEQVTARHAGRREDQAVAGRQIIGHVDAVLVSVAHPTPALALLGVAVPEPGLDLATETAQGPGRDDALGRAADAHDGVDTRTRDRTRDRGRQVTVADQLDP